MLESLMDVV